MFSLRDAIDFFVPADLLMPEPEYAWQMHPADLLGELVWVKLYDIDDDEFLCYVDDWREWRGELYALFTPVSGRCERWRKWSCAIEVAKN